MPEGALALPTGTIRQRPPGALGRQSRRRARLPPRPARRGDGDAAADSRVHRFAELWREDDRAEFEIECSSGTYVRSLIADLGDAYCEELRRTAIGPFAVEEADAESAAAARATALERAPGPDATVRGR